jgi:hypothetical protein
VKAPRAVTRAPMLDIITELAVIAWRDAETARLRAIDKAKLHQSPVAQWHADQTLQRATVKAWDEADALETLIQEQAAERR